jgi:Transposase DDE domain
VPQPQSSTGIGAEPLHLLVDSTGLKLCGAGEWLLEKHGTKTRRSWRKLHIGMDADTGKIVAAALTTNDVDDASQVGPLLDQIEGPLASFTGDGAYDQDGVYRAVMGRDPDAAVIVPPRATAVPSETAGTAPTPRDQHLRCIAEKGKIGWQKVSGYTKRSRVEAAIGRYKQVIGDGLRSHKDERCTTEVGVAVHVLNRMLELGRPISVRIPGCVAVSLLRRTDVPMCLQLNTPGSRIGLRRTQLILGRQSGAFGSCASSRYPPAGSEHSRRT